MHPDRGVVRVRVVEIVVEERLGLECRLDFGVLCAGSSCRDGKDERKQMRTVLVFMVSPRRSVLGVNSSRSQLGVSKR
jgi:hypothetical protein